MGVKYTRTGTIATRKRSVLSTKWKWKRKRGKMDTPWKFPLCRLFRTHKTDGSFHHIDLSVCNYQLWSHQDHHAEQGSNWCYHCKIEPSIRAWKICPKSLSFCGLGSNEISLGSDGNSDVRPCAIRIWRVRQVFGGFLVCIQIIVRRSEGTNRIKII